MIDVNYALKKLKQNKIDNVYLLLGEEYYLIDRFKQSIEKRLRDKVFDEITHYDLRDTPIQEIVFDAETLPFFSEHKLIFVSNPIFLQSKPEKVSIQHDLTILENYLQNDLNDMASTIVFIAPYEKIDARKKITKLINKHTVVDCQPIKEYEVKRWIHHFAKQYQLMIEEDAVLLLESELGTNLYILENEIKKIALHIDKNEKVTSEIILQLISPSMETNALQLVDVVLNKNLPKALSIYSDLIKIDGNPIGLIALLAFQFRTIYQVKLLRRKNLSEEQIRRTVNLHPYVVQLALKRSNQFSSEELELIIRELTATDSKIKRGEMNMHIAFELLLYQLIHHEK